MKKAKKILKIIKTFMKYVYYKIYCIIKKIDNTNIWIIAERGNDARDNSFHLFEYIKKNQKNINIKYVIDFNSVDYKKVKNIGECVKYGSKEHFILFITAGVLISTHDMGYSPDMSLFTRLNNKGLLRIKGKKIYINHGINKEIMSVPNCDLTTVGGYLEYLKTIEKFPNKTIKYTGLPRFDNLPLEHKKSNTILFMPTFRKWLVYSNEEEFKKSNYYKSINSLLNSSKMKSLLENNNYKLIFYPHFEVQNRLKLFKTNCSKVIIASFNNYDVQNLLINSDILITDFSSVFFDFAYMKKPVIYYQFDENEYRSKHYERGYFDYRRDGFGNVVEHENELIKIVENTIENGNKIEKNKENNINKFFKYVDKFNCKRVYDAINTILEKKE